MKLYCILCFAVAGMLFFGCKSDPVQPTSKNGSISGYVQLYDADGNSLISSAGVNVSISSSDFNAQTDDSGKWIISDLPPGVYSLNFTKAGFGKMEIIGYQFVGNGSAFASNVQMSRPSNEIINFQDFSVALNMDSSRSYDLVAAMPPPYTEIRSVLLCIGTDSATLASDPSSALFVSSYAKGGSGYDGSFTISGTDIIDRTKNLLWRGTKLYATLAVAGEGHNGQNLSNYFDPQTNRQVYTSVSPHSQILSTLMP